MTELELLVDLHKGTERQGPGSTTDTLQALSLMCVKKDQKLKVADIGCGSGGQTITLANNLEGHITAIDLFPDFLHQLNQKVAELGLRERVSTLEISMDDLPFDENELDIIWSEGAIYNIGFETGIKKWKKYLKSGGYIAVSEITWLTNSRPTAIQEYWDKAYSEIDTASNKMKILEENGFTPVGYFILPQSSWLDNYYKPLKNKMPSFLEKHNNSPMAQSIVEESKEEMRLYNKYKDYYSYGFYIANKL